MNKDQWKRRIILWLPYLVIALFCTKFGKAWRLAEGADLSAKILSFFNAIPVVLKEPFPSFRLLDLLIGTMCGMGMWVMVYLKSRDAKKYRHNVEYGSARWSA